MVRTACWSIVAIQEAFHCLERSRKFLGREKEKNCPQIYNFLKFGTSEDYALNKFQHGYNSLLKSSI